jgi:hypothetical protein
MTPGDADPKNIRRFQGVIQEEVKTERHRSFFNHARSCDPVVVDDTLDYITLRSGTTCDSILNNLEILNVKDISKPVLVVLYGMTNPHGLFSYLFSF